ncbi:arylamine N-acetyltransferase family protein [Mesobacillus selenatarsenatis]|uniref:N-acetyltransferase family protein n=1 Tax=Mesobacillus selenatarsenatis (strain DSM 18680 / JCM 14380 / FERM P-15431 / SF-1) TaxID=1321606 RepID=A0A0A8XAA0_MESS1|nr:arylamine N-acetyltransferase [Mesobacillus selenatarsenatis]GAM15922.1 N-acetyltransferase family protein [Mesobacillus selenatarsenatis SF-1]
MELNHLFRKRIGFFEIEKITVASLGVLLEMTAATLPFENLCTLSGDLSDLNEERLIDKILLKNEGGLCYDLNGILYLFLKENGLDVQLVRGSVYVPDFNGFSPTGRTHAAILLKAEGERFLVDTGFGGNLPLRPVPMDGTEISSPNGDFRVKQHDSEFGDYILEMKLKYKDSDWRMGYAFDSREPVGNVSDLSEMKKIITEHPQSPFNKKPLLTRVTATGSMVLTETSFTQWTEDGVKKEDIDSERFKGLAKEFYNIELK